MELRYLAFYLPQFHPTPENDVWWGRGFTEWRNVVRAQPLFEGHHQPHLPADLGFYDLRLPEARAAQAHLASTHGIDGFVYYHYWFGGRRLLERPFEEVLRSGEPGLPFALCWANEPWTRSWSGRGSSYMVAQTYSDDDDDAHIAYLLDAFADERYITVGGRPLLLVYNMRALPDARRTVERWAAACDRAGVAAPFVVKCDTFLDDGDPARYGADAACEFPPHGVQQLVPATRHDEPVPHERIDYAALATASVRRPPVAWTRYPTVAPGWDNSPRRTGGGATVLEGSTPERYEQWLVEASRRIATEVDEPIVFVNAWNEWAEGAHLEPDDRWGRGFLDATLRARRTVVPGYEPAAVAAGDGGAGRDVSALYEDLLERHRALEAEATKKFEAGQEALRTAVEEREADIEALRDDLRRAQGWGDQLDAALRRAEGELDETLRADVARLAAEADALRAELDALGRHPAAAARAWLRHQGWARRVAAVARATAGRRDG